MSASDIVFVLGLIVELQNLQGQIQTNKEQIKQLLSRSQQFEAIITRIRDDSEDTLSVIVLVAVADLMKCLIKIKDYVERYKKPKSIYTSMEKYMFSSQRADEIALFHEELNRHNLYLNTVYLMDTNVKADIAELKDLLLHKLGSNRDLNESEEAKREDQLTKLRLKDFSCVKYHQV